MGILIISVGNEQELLGKERNSLYTGTKPKSVGVKGVLVPN